MLQFVMVPKSERLPYASVTTGQSCEDGMYYKLMYLLPLRKGNVFTSVCHSSCPQEGGLPGAGGFASRGICIRGGGLPGGSLHPGGSASRMGLGRPLPPSDTMGYSQRAGGTHPTGMHSCF